MKITEIIDDLKRLNAYLPTDPDKKYPAPLERMARELWLIREFALAGDQAYVSAQLELRSENHAGLSVCCCQAHKTIHLHCGETPQGFPKKPSTATLKDQAFGGATENQTHNQGDQATPEQAERKQDHECKKFLPGCAVCSPKKIALVQACHNPAIHSQELNQRQSTLRTHASFYYDPLWPSISIVDDTIHPKNR